MKNLIVSNEYIKSEDDRKSLDLLMNIFEKNIQPDGVRNRAYLKLIWNREFDTVELAKNQTYFQSKSSNIMDGGKARNFAKMDPSILDLTVMHNAIHSNLKRVKEFGSLKNEKNLVLGLHFIQYKAQKYQASYSSPDTLHIDDEPLVFIHLLNLTENAWGGDNLIADINTKEITNVVRLEKPFDTMVLTQDYYHAVTPLGSREGEAQRDIILFTVEPFETQID